MPPLSPQSPQPVARDGEKGPEEGGPGVWRPFVWEESGQEIIEADGGEDGEVEEAGD